MKNKIVTLTSEKFGTVRTITEGENVLFCASDVAKALGYKDTINATKQHCKGVVKRHPTISSSRKPEINFIPESDVYRLICHSKLPSAMEFERWVFEEAVPKAVRDMVAPEPEQLTLETSEYHYFDKMYNGEPVLTAADVEHFTGLNQNSIAWYLKKYGKRGKDFFLLTKVALRAYKEENPSVSKLSSAAFLVTKSGFKKALKYYDRKANMPECFIESKTPKLPEKSAAGAVEIKLPEKPEIQPRREFTAAEYIVALEVLNSLRIKFRENLSRPNCFYPEVEEDNIKSINVAMEYVAMPLSVGTKI